MNSTLTIKELAEDILNSARAHHNSYDTTHKRHRIPLYEACRVHCHDETIAIVFAVLSASWNDAILWARAIANGNAVGERYPTSSDDGAS